MHEKFIAYKLPESVSTISSNGSIFNQWGFQLCHELGDFHPCAPQLHSWRLAHAGLQGYLTKKRCSPRRRCEPKYT